MLVDFIASAFFKYDFFLFSYIMVFSDADACALYTRAETEKIINSKGKY